MKEHPMVSRWALVLVLLLTVALCAGCSGDTGGDLEDNPDEYVVEPGLPVDVPEDTVGDGEDTDEPDVPEGPQFEDKGESATLEDLAANLELIESYYFEQDIPYVDGHVYMQIWYKDGLMKVVTSVDGYGLSEYYYNYDDNTVINYAPGSDTPAMKMAFDPAGVDAPDNPKLRDYTADCTVSGFEVIDRQNCMVLETAEGSTLWVSTANGFPMQVYYEDSMGDFWTVKYKNLRLNSVEDKELLLDSAVEVVDYSSAR